MNRRIICDYFSLLCNEASRGVWWCTYICHLTFIELGHCWPIRPQFLQDSSKVALISLVPVACILLVCGECLSILSTCWIQFFFYIPKFSPTILLLVFLVCLHLFCNPSLYISPFISRILISAAVILFLALYLHCPVFIPIQSVSTAKEI